MNRSWGQRAPLPGSPCQVGSRAGTVRRDDSIGRGIVDSIRRSPPWHPAGSTLSARGNVVTSGAVHRDQSAGPAYWTHRRSRISPLPTKKGYRRPAPPTLFGVLPRPWRSRRHSRQRHGHRTPIRRPGSDAGWRHRLPSVPDGEQAGNQSSGQGGVEFGESDDAPNYSAPQGWSFHGFLRLVGKVALETTRPGRARSARVHHATASMPVITINAPPLIHSPAVSGNGS